VVVTLGSVRLCEHAIQIGGTVRDLADVVAQSQLTYESALLQIRPPNGQNLLERYSTEVRNDGHPSYRTEHKDGIQIIHTNQSRKRDNSEEQVIGIENVINNQVIWHQQFVEQLPAIIPQARVRLETERGNDADLRAN